AKFGYFDARPVVLHVGHCRAGRNVLALRRAAEQGLAAVLVASTSTVTDKALLLELRRAGVRVVTGFVENIQELYQMADC
ncbi:hypothetical protein AAHZ94_35330, partial [Streptomyces sp. HSW2009]|uniref:hypothetical protein n=1 Tax=Streptomyces sp. HSW2009 TaxID=3142890 RepID=UPI0032EE3E8B